MAKFNKILLIEDDTFISELYIRQLKKAGYEVKAVINGPEGLTLAQSGEYDLILLDIMIPDMTGLEVLDKVRDSKAFDPAKTKIVITTNLDQDDASRAATESKVDGYLIKADVTPKSLVKFIQQMEKVS